MKRLFVACLILSACGGPADEAAVSETSLSVDRDSCEIEGEDYDCRIDLRYGPFPIQTLDLWLPMGRPPAEGRPLVVFVHGGGYFSGDKNFGYGRVFDPRPILDAGFAYATINYRLSGSFPFEKGVTGAYPPAMADGGRAIQFLRTQAAAHGLDPSRIALTGSSAGGGISLWLAFHDDLADPTGPTALARASTRVSCAAVIETQTTLNIPEVDALLGPNFELDEGLSVRARRGTSCVETAAAA